MLYYIASNVYAKSITEVIQNTGQIVENQQTGDKISFTNLIKKDISTMNNIDLFLIDVNALTDHDEEFVESIEMFRMMYNNVRIIILASGRVAGDSLLVQCFQMGIYDIVASHDFNVIKSELTYCIETGKTYKQSIIFKDQKLNEKVVVKSELKKTIYKVFVGMAGTQKHIGTTHNTILLANFLRKNGFRVAVCEVLLEHEDETDYKLIRESFEERRIDGCFSLNNVDYYENMIANDLYRIEKNYNFILLDFGSFMTCDKVMFNKCEIKMLVSGSKSYEVSNINQIFDNLSLEALKEYHFIFNYTPEYQHKDLVNEMKEFSENVHFARYEPDVYESSNFNDGEKIFSSYIVTGVQPEKTGLLKKIKRRISKDETNR